MLQKIIASLQRLYGKRDTCECWSISRNILLKLIFKFNQTTLEKANLYAAFCLVFARFLQMGDFTYNKVKNNFSFWNLTQGFISFSED